MLSLFLCTADLVGWYSILVRFFFVCEILVQDFDASLGDFSQLGCDVLFSIVMCTEHYLTICITSVL